LDRLKASIEVCLTQIEKWFNANKLTINSQKTAYMVFLRPNQSPNSVVLNLTLNGSPIQKVSSIKYLGVMLDECFSWSEQISVLYNKLVKFIPLFYRMKKTLPYSVLRNIYFSLVFPHLYSNIELFYTASRKCLNKLVVLNNKLIRILQSQSKFTNLITLYKNFNLLPMYKLAEYKILLLAHKWFYHDHMLPVFFRNIFQKSTNVFKHKTRNIYDLYVVRSRSKILTSSFRFACVSYWNRLPVNLTCISSLSIFKHKLHAYLMN